MRKRWDFASEDVCNIHVNLLFVIVDMIAFEKSSGVKEIGMCYV